MLPLKTWPAPLGQAVATPCSATSNIIGLSDSEKLARLVKERQVLEHLADTQGLRPREMECLNDFKIKIEALLRQPSSFESRNYEYMLAWGQNLWLDRKFSDAEATLLKAAELKPERIAALWFLGSLVEVQRRAEESLSFYKRIVKLKAQNEDEQKFRLSAATKLFERGDFGAEAKLQFAQEWLAQYPESTEAIRALGEAAIEVQSVEALIEARKKEKDTQTGWWIQAHISFLQGRFAESLSIAQKFYKATPVKEPFAKAYFRLVTQNYQKLNQADRAYKFLLSMPVSIKEDPELQKLFEEVVIQNTSWGPSQLQVASGFYPKSLRLQVQALDTLMRQSPIELAEFDPVAFRAAAAFAERLVSQKFGLVDAHYWRGYMAFQSKNFREADQEFLQCLNLMREGQQPLGRGLEMGRVFASAGLNKVAQHYTAEASEIVERGLSVVRDRKNKELLQKLKARVEKQSR